MEEKERLLDWLDDKKLVILAVVGITVAGATMFPDMVKENFGAVLTGLFGIAIGRVSR